MEAVYERKNAITNQRICRDNEKIKATSPLDMICAFSPMPVKLPPRKWWKIAWLYIKKTFSLKPFR